MRAQRGRALRHLAEQPAGTARGPLGPEGGAVGRMASTASADSPKVRALSANANAGEPRSSSTPPSAGPRMMPAPATADRAALAPGRSASSTRRGVTAATHGRYGAAAAVAAAAITGASTIGSRAAATAASTDHEPHPDQVAGDHDAAAVEPVGEHSAERTERHDRHDPGRGGDARPQRRVGAVVDQHDQGQVVEPVADLGHGQGRQEPAECRVAQRGADGARGRVLCVHALHGRAKGPAAHRRAAVDGRVRALISAGGALGARWDAGCLRFWLRPRPSPAVIGGGLDHRRIAGPGP